jgi:iron complex outermembrane recepter protein
MSFCDATNLSAPHQRSLRNKRLLLKTAVALAIYGTSANYVLAQTTVEEVEEVVVTGSRILRKDFASDSPIVTMSTESLENTADVSLDRALAKLPQVGLGSNQFSQAASITLTPTASPGISTVNLRNLGNNRTLVLLDGRRTQPNNAALVVDINTIPKAAIESVEIITGGAGSTYGADAVAGVVNFILKHNYEGLSVSARTGITEEGLGAQNQLSVLGGANYGDGDRGNLMFGLTWTKREAVYQSDRDFYSALWSDPKSGTAALFPNLTGVQGGTVSTITHPESPATGVTGATRYFNTVSDPSLIAGASLFTIAGNVSNPNNQTIPGYTGQMAGRLRVLANGSIANVVDAPISLPTEHYSAFGRTQYEINDYAKFYFQANFDNSTTTTSSGAFSPGFSQWSVSVPRDANHVVPTALATLLDARTTPGSRWGLNRPMDFMGAVTLNNTTRQFELLTGMTGDLGVLDWTYDVFGSHGETNQLTAYLGVVDLASYQALIDLPNYGAGARYFNPRTGIDATCTSGVNPFLSSAVSQDCINILDANLRTTTALVQNQVEATIQGLITNLPAGEMRFAAGAGYRSNDYQYVPDKGFSTQNITSLGIGQFDASKTLGQLSVRELFGELLMPLFKDIPAVKSLDLNLGYRTSEYDTSAGRVGTWKATSNWAIVDAVTIRGGYQVTNRAPNVDELFAPPTYVVVNTTVHDPCSNFTDATWGNSAANPNRTEAIRLCNEIVYRNSPTPMPADPALRLITAGFVGQNPTLTRQHRDRQVGNADLKPEEAKTITVGTVFRSPFSNPYLEKTTMTIDYYNIKVEDAIQRVGADLSYQYCFNAFGTNPTLDANYVHCKNVIRDSTNGFWLAVNAPYINIGQIETSGVDFQFDWSARTPFFGGEQGTISANVKFNYLLKFDRQDDSLLPVLEYANATGGYTKWTSLTTLGYAVGGVSANLEWTHIPSVRDIGKVSLPTAPQLPVDAYDLFSLKGRWVLSHRVTLTAGVENLLDKDPPRTSVTPTDARTGFTDGGIYDILGRRYYLGLSLSL